MKLSFEIVKDSAKENIDIDFPNSWDEVSPSNWLAVLMLRQSCVVQDVPKKEWKNPFAPEKIIFCANYLSAFQAVSMLNKEVDEFLFPELIDEIIKQLDWLKELPNHYHSLKKWVGIWKGPKDKLIDWTWARYCFAEQEFQRYAEALSDSDQDQLSKSVNRLFAMLYSPFGVWSVRLAPLFIYLSRFISNEKKSVAIGNYSGMRNWLQDLYYLAFKRTESGEVEQDGLRKLTIAMAGDKFGKVDETFRAKMHDILIYQSSLIEQSNALKANE